ncbi:hypothetical protein EV688_104140 [Chromatocurvus halotolerans]|uniref:Uncharacterized protein n=2 Tax=Chromatocurvus halotolerans TaxID=1132028 RepID=A0A4R2KZ77_9GAMM|nr:hypothetical protein EV688_104140 [Chromatocurvus halotolerans]
MRLTALDSRRTCLLALCVLGPLLAWMGVLDGLSEQSVDSALLATGAAYASARGINALVSVMQGTEVHAVMLTVAAGEVLDPINDLIERISTLFLFALGSLALQKTLLLLAAERAFNLLLTVAAIVSAITLLQPRRNGVATNLVLRLFLVTLFLRFALGVSALASGWIDAAFLAERDKRQRAAMEHFRGELAALESADPDQTGQGWLQRLRNSVSPAEVRARLSALEARVDDFAASAMTLAMSLLLKSIVLPLAFLYAVLAGSRALLKGPPQPR